MNFCALLHEEASFHLNKQRAPPTVFLEENLRKDARDPQTKPVFVLKSGRQWPKKC